MGPGRIGRFASWLMPASVVHFISAMLVLRRAADGRVFHISNAVYMSKYNRQFRADKFDKQNIQIFTHFSHVEDWVVTHYWVTYMCDNFRILLIEFIRSKLSFLFAYVNWTSDSSPLLAGQTEPGQLQGSAPHHIAAGQYGGQLCLHMPYQRDGTLKYSRLTAASAFCSKTGRRRAEDCCRIQRGLSAAY